MERERRRLAGSGRAGSLDDTADREHEVVVVDVVATVGVPVGIVRVQSEAMRCDEISMMIARVGLGR